MRLPKPLWGSNKAGRDSIVESTPAGNTSSKAEKGIEDVVAQVAQLRRDHEQLFAKTRQEITRINRELAIVKSTISNIQSMRPTVRSSNPHR